VAADRLRHKGSEPASWRACDESVPGSRTGPSGVAFGGPSTMPWREAFLVRFGAGDLTGITLGRWLRDHPGPGMVPTQADLRTPRGQ
jgi:hypothetical protein